MNAFVPMSAAIAHLDLHRKEIMTTLAMVDKGLFRDGSTCTGRK